MQLLASINQFVELQQLPNLMKSNTQPSEELIDLHNSIRALYVIYPIIYCFRNYKRLNEIISKNSAQILNALDYKHRVPSLFLACYQSDPEQCFKLIKMLIKKGADPSFQDINGQNILFLICINEKVKIMEFLLQKCRLDLNSIDKFGQTVLFYIAKHGQNKVLESLRKKEIKVEINHYDKMCQSALFYAVIHGHLETCQILVSLGANFTHLDINGYSLLHYSKKHSHFAITKYFESLIHQSPQYQYYHLFRIDQELNQSPMTIQQVVFFMTQHQQFKIYFENPSEIDKQIQFELHVAQKEEWQKRAKQLLKLVLKCQGSKHFLEAIDEEKYGVCDYYKVIEKPMWFNKIKKQLDFNVYEKIQDFIEDMQLVFDNCLRYNGPQNYMTQFALQMKDVFEENFTF